MTNTDSVPFMNSVPTISVRENERGAEIGAGSNPHYHQATDRYSTFSDKDFRLGLNAAQAIARSGNEARQRVRRDKRESPFRRPSSRRRNKVIALCAAKTLNPSDFHTAEHRDDSSRPAHRCILRSRSADGRSAVREN
jgi:hypothetical protein